MQLYEYLYAASSRAIHFSAGEALRRTWYDANGNVNFEDVDHRLYLSDFALHQLAFLAIGTIVTSGDWLKEKSDSGNEAKTIDAELVRTLEAYSRLPKVPLVLAKEYEVAWKRPKFAMEPNRATSNDGP